MLGKNIKYTDFNDVERTEMFYFSLSEAEVTELELSYPGGFTSYLRGILNKNDIPAIAAMFKDLILRSYGEKSDDGKRFIKSTELSTAFSQTEAYSNLYVSLITDVDSATEFVKNIMPRKLKENFEAKTKGMTQEQIAELASNYELKK